MRSTVFHEMDLPLKCCSIGVSPLWRLVARKQRQASFNHFKKKGQTEWVDFSKPLET